MKAQVVDATRLNNRVMAGYHEGLFLFEQKGKVYMYFNQDGSIKPITPTRVEIKVIDN